jgi:predicted restriction endonuclease
MYKLEEYLDNYDNKEIYKDDLYNYKKFNYIDELIFNNHLTFLLENIYNIKVIEIDKSRVRLNQKDFRDGLLEKFNNKCVVTDEDCIDELEACHIIPINEKECYNIDNGLILTSNLHKTFDKYLWSINPNTLKIEIKNNKNVGNIKKYESNKINIKLNNDLFNNLNYHYNKFLINN